jgi:hypothetical protein
MLAELRRPLISSPAGPDFLTRMLPRQDQLVLDVGLVAFMLTRNPQEIVEFHAFAARCTDHAGARLFVITG